MSAGKLEKKMAALERRMREELHGQLSSLWLRLQIVEEKMRIETAAGPEADRIDVAGDLVLPGSAMSAVVPSTVADAKSRKGDIAARAPVFEPHIGEMEEEDQDEEPIPFAETVWNVVLVLGSTGAGWIDLCLTMLLAVGSIMLQFLFVFVLVSEEFLGGNFGAEIAAARTWRASIAHDAKYRDLSGTSLASRVCNGDGSLIQSNEQANLLADINSFLGLPSQEFAVSGLAPGMILSGLCMLLWCMYLCREFRTIWISMEAILHIPRARKTDFSSGRFAAISYFRLAAYLILRLYRTAITGCLLWAGQQWLANTKSITGLILNASALGTILEIDELVFASLLPKKIQAAIYSLEAVKVRYTRAKSQLEATLIFIGVVAVTLAPIFLWVMPLVDNMQQVKSEFCYGAQNFVVAYNQDSQTTVGLATPSFAVRYENGLSLSERAVLGHTVPTAQTTFVGPYDWNLIYFADDPDTFARDTVISQASISDQIVDCLDADDWPRRYGPTYAEREMPRFHAAAAMIGRDNATTCAELADKCGDFDSRLLRSVCPLTCGCHLPQANQWFKVPAQGCPNICRDEATKRSQDIPCRDSPLGDDWLAFWGSYPDVMQEHLGVNFSDPNNPITGSEFVHGLTKFMQTAGCPGLISVAQEPITRTDWCRGNTLFASLAYICPLSCGCWAEDAPDYCPRSCKACGDDVGRSGMTVVEGSGQTAASAVPLQMPQVPAQYFAAGIGDAADAELLCLVTGGNDGPLPDLFGLGTCADVQAAGWCPLLNFLDSSVSFICGRSCGTCT